MSKENCHRCRKRVDESDLRLVDLDKLWCPACVYVFAKVCGFQDHLCSEGTKVLLTVNEEGEPEEEFWCSACVTTYSVPCEREGCSYRTGRNTGRPVYDRVGRIHQWCAYCFYHFSGRCERCRCDGAYESLGLVHCNRNRDQRLWCESCRDFAAYWCPDCARLFDVEHDHEDEFEREREYEDEDEDENEHEDEDEKVVAPYHEAQRRGIKFKPCVSDWTRKQPKPLYFGVELEVLVPSGRDREPYAQQVLDSIGPKFGDFLYDIQHDGSLGWSGEAGFEIITQPCGLDTHREHWSRANFTSLLNDRNGIKAGLHVHISRSAFKKVGGIDLERHPVIARMAAFLYADENKKFVESIARRTFNEFARHLADTQISQAAHGGPVAFSGHEARYEALNLSGDKTVEFRLPKSTTEPTTIMATLEFVFLLLRFCEQASNEELDVKHFKKFIVEDRWSTDSRFLRAYLVDRGLATAQEMKLPRLKPEGLRTNPSRRPRLRDDAPGPYARRALAEYRRTGELP